jgi:hypothetical protein
MDTHHGSDSKDVAVVPSFRLDPAPMMPMPEDEDPEDHVDLADIRKTNFFAKRDQPTVAPKKRAISKPSVKNHRPTAVPKKLATPKSSAKRPRATSQHLRLLRPTQPGPSQPQVS